MVGRASQIGLNHTCSLQSDSCFLEEVLLPLKCFMLCEALASWNRLFAPVFLFTQIPSLIELITLL